MTRQPPTDDVAEQALLGAMLLGSAVGVDVVANVLATGLTARHFARPANQHIAEAIIRVHRGGGHVEVIVVAAELRRSGLLDEVGGTGVLHALQNEVPSVSNAEKYAVIVRDLAELRRLIYVASELSQGAFDGDDQRIRRAVASVNGGSAVGVGAMFPMLSVADLVASVDAADPPRFVVSKVLIEGDYGVIGAEPKFGKSLLAADFAVNVAAGGKVLGHWAVNYPGTVLVFAGEGGRRKLARRLRAIAVFYDHDLTRLPIHIYERAPKLADLEQVERLRATVVHHRPRLVIIDPSYLAVSGAETKNLASMGELLERVQLLCQEAGAALLLTHHWNKTGTGEGASRFTGAGFAEWGRVLISGTVLSSTTDVTLSRSTVICKLVITGDELAETTIAYRRAVRVDDRDDVTSAMHYTVEIIDAAAGMPTDAQLSLSPGVKLKPATKRVLVVLLAAAPNWLDAREIGDRLADAGHPLKVNTIYEACKALIESGLAAASTVGPGAARTWTAVAHS